MRLDFTEKSLGASSRLAVLNEKREKLQTKLKWKEKNKLQKKDEKREK